MDIDTSRTVWSVVVVCVIAYLVYLFWGAYITAVEEEKAREIVIRQRVENNEHILTGIVMAPSKCHDLTIEAKAINSSTHHIAFATPKVSVGCAEVPEARSFRVIIPVSSNAERFIGSLNGEAVRLRIEPAE